ncbi:MAG: SDR family NAD(P)-dependent oxidoreductase [Gordonia sp. (in: high G+C Gram-positive bacteria)]
MTDNDFAGKVVLVTGAGQGIGQATAQMLADRGATVAVADLNADTAQAVAEQVGGGARAYPCDVTDRQQMLDVVKQIQADLGKLDGAVNNAGIAGDFTSILDYPLDLWRQTMAVNLDGVFYSLQAELPAIIAAGGGAVVNVASVMGTVAQVGQCAYNSSKHAVVGLTKSAALDVTEFGVRVNAVGPGFIDTPMLSVLDEEGYKALSNTHPIGRTGKPEEVAALIVFLLSDAAGFITASYHLVDGGYSAV